MGEVLHHAQFDHPVGEEAHGPAGASLGRITASEQSELGFDFSGHFHRSRGSHRLFADHPRNVGVEEAASGIGNGQGRATEKFSDLIIGIAFLLRAVEQERDAHSGQSAGLMLAGA